MTWLMVNMQFMLKMKLTYHFRLERVLFVMKTRQDNNVTNRTTTIYVKNDIELLWLIESGAICNKNQIG